MIYEFANAKDLDGIQSLLRVCDLPTKDLEEHLGHFIVAKQQEQIVGCIGLELQGPLLRSLAVDPGYRGHGIAKKLCERLLAHAKTEGATEIFLLTTTAPVFFEKVGFERKNREDAPEIIRKHKQFLELCPTSAILMRKQF